MCKFTSCLYYITPCLYLVSRDKIERIMHTHTHGMHTRLFSYNSEALCFPFASNDVVSSRERNTH